MGDEPTGDVVAVRETTVVRNRPRGPANDAKTQLKAARKALRVAQRLADALLPLFNRVAEGLEGGEITVPSVLDEKYLLAVSRSAQSLSMAVRHAVEAGRAAVSPIDVGRTPEHDAPLDPEVIHTVEIVRLLKRLTPEERAELVQSGQVPRRIMGAVASPTDLEDAEDPLPAPARQQEE